MEYKLFLLHPILKHFKVSNRSQISRQPGGIVGPSKGITIMKEVDQGYGSLKLKTVISFVSHLKS